MRYRVPPQFDMLLDGRFRMPRRPTLPMRVAGVALVIAVLAGTLAIAALVLWLAVALIPIAIVAGLVAWAALRFQLWRSRRSPGGPPDIYRP